MAEIYFIISGIIILFFILLAVKSITNKNKNKESQSQQAVGYSLSLKLEKNRSKLWGIKPNLSNKQLYVKD